MFIQKSEQRKFMSKSNGLFERIFWKVMHAYMPEERLH